MGAKNAIRVSEFQKLYYDDTKPFRQKHWKALCCYLESVNKQGRQTDYFRILNRGIQFTSYVGVIQAGDLTIEILPKIDKASTTAVNESVAERQDNELPKQSVWQKALLQMLKECRFLKVAHVDYAALNLRSNSLLDIYIELFLAETETLLHHGLLKKYRKAEGNRTALKGQLQFAKQVTHNATHAERFYMRHTEYNRNNSYNQILFKTLRTISAISQNPHLLDKATRLLLDFPEMAPISVTADTFDRLQYDRKTERYKEAMLIAKMLLLNYRPDITGGTENVVAILFDMNKLWEEWVYRRLKREEGFHDITVHRQQSEDFWTAAHLARPKTIRPDIVIKQGANTIVVDTKWKLVENRTPSDEDLKQMFVYNLFWNCNRSVLLYPAHQPGRQEGDYNDFAKTKPRHSQCAVVTASIFDGGQKLDEDFGITVLKNIFV